MVFDRRGTWLSPKDCPLLFRLKNRHIINGIELIVHEHHRALSGIDGESFFENPKNSTIGRDFGIGDTFVAKEKT
jgi:hypothetical protein